MNAAAKYTAKKLLNDKINKNKKKDVCGKDDPFFDLVKGPRGKIKKVKKIIPYYIPEHDAQILADVRNYAYKMDMCLFDFCGVRFGWSSVIGLVPELGDVADFLIAMRCYNKIRGVDCGLSKKDHAIMIGNIGLDFAVGLVPFVGDLADAGFKCNTRNAVRLSNALIKHYGKDLSAEEKARAEIELLDDDPDAALDPPPPYKAPTLPKRTAAPMEHSSDARGWLGGRREREVDPEMGQVPRR